MTQKEDLKSLEKKLKAKLTELHALHKKGASLAQTLMIYPEELEATYALGLQMLSAKKNKEAAQLLSGLCLMEPYDGRFWRVLGLALQKIERPALALAAFEMALVLIPDDIPTLAYRGETFILLGRRAEARVDLERVVAKAKPNAEDAPFVQRAKGLMPYAQAKATR